MEGDPGGERRGGRARTPDPAPPPPPPGAPPPSPGAAATPAAAGAIHGKGPARVQSRRRRRHPPGRPGTPGEARGFPPPTAAAAAPPRRRRRRRGRAGDGRWRGRDGPRAGGSAPGRGRGRRRLVQPRRAPSPASRPSPTDPALRANPYPEVTDPACRLPLPTLFQHARGCSPWRPAADMGTARREIYTLSPGFSRAGESSPDAAGTATLSKARAPLSGRTHSRAALPFTKKRELSPGLPPASPGSVALPHWTPRGAHLRHSGFGDLNPTPFRSAEGNGGHRPSLRNGARPSLRTD